MGRSALGGRERRGTGQARRRGRRVGPPSRRNRSRSHRRQPARQAAGQGHPLRAWTRHHEAPRPPKRGRATTGPPNMTKAPHQTGGAPPSFAVSGREF
nr:MAG TPA: hypothetical protein [Caudoviricetes sp.]